MQLIEIRDVTKRYNNGVTALYDINLWIFNIINTQNEVINEEILYDNSNPFTPKENFVINILL